MVSLRLYRLPTRVDLLPSLIVRELQLYPPLLYSYLCCYLSILWPAHMTLDTYQTLRQFVELKMVWAWNEVRQLYKHTNYAVVG